MIRETKKPCSIVADDNTDLSRKVAAVPEAVTASWYELKGAAPTRYSRFSHTWRVYISRH